MMDFINSFIDNFSEYFNWEHTVAILSDPVSWGIIASLVLLEGLLSADNALVLAVLVKHLPKEQQKKALFYGLLGAYVFRFLAISIGTFLVKITWVKVIGGLYLLWIACSHLFHLEVKWVRAGKIPVLPYIGRNNDAAEEDQVENKARGFWRTVLTVELMDIAFSVDSVIAAFGVSEQVWVLFLGGILGVLMMRGVAQVFLKLIGRYPELEKAAFILIIIIGLKMLAAVVGFHLPHIVFFALLIAVFVGAIILSTLRKKSQDTTTKSA
ncbi:YkoY family integral membrane protein [Fontibacillus solani]|uniref:Integral membrane protein, YkoY family n=3 Tax=Paenibacillaceae TaxID=186822 RepID=A0A1G7NCB6_9BACL|nr:YkoY family integral membrane protein [Fontibacillus solani]SDF71654.1 integral membrane protein, YkoY family [Fontibacillus panacisegetis]